MASHTLSLETADLMASGEVTVIQFNRSYAYRIHRDDWPAYREAKRTGFVMLPRSEERARRLGKVWWSWCEARNWPVIHIVPRAKYASVEADMIMLPARSITDHMLTPIHALFEEHCVGGWWSSSTDYLYASRIPIPLAPFVATRIVDLLWAALSLPERTGQ